jgi:hypothetical protein
MQTYGLSGMTKVLVTFRNFEITPKKDVIALDRNLKAMFCVEVMFF